MRKFAVQLITWFLLGLGCATGIHSQGKPKPDLSGTWALDRGRSNVGKASTAGDELKIRIMILNSR